MLYVIQSAITHQFVLVKFSIFVKFQENVLPYVNPVSIFVDQSESDTIDITMRTGLGKISRFLIMRCNIAVC